MNIMLRGRLDTPHRPIAPGHRVTAKFTRRLTVGAQAEPSHTERALLGTAVDEEATPLHVPAAADGTVASDGTFALELIPKESIAGPITLQAMAPDGTIIGTTPIALEAVDSLITLTVSEPPPLVATASGSPAVGQIVRLIGRVLDDAGGKTPSGLHVIIWGVRHGGSDGDAAPIVVASTQKNGYFSGLRPLEVLDFAFGTVGVSKPIPIPLGNDGRLPERVLLVTHLAALAVRPEDDCSCNDAPPRAPDTTDIVSNPSVFSTDLGGGRCVNLNTPNRVIEEFSYFKVVRTTQPVIRGVAPPSKPALPPPVIAQIATLAATSSRDREVRVIDPTLAKSLLAYPENVTERSLASAEVTTAFQDVFDTVQAFDNPIADRELQSTSAISWDGPSLPFQATTVAHGHLLHFKQTWRADGYSLGDLLYSLPLAPCQKKQIAVIDWERRETAARQERLEEEEALAALLARDRDVSEIIHSSLRQNESGGSSTNMSGGGGGLGIGFIGGGFGIFAGGGGGAGGSSSEAWSDSSRTLAASSLQQIRDNTMQSASAVRDQRSTVVQSVHQAESTRVETEVVANHNHCHAITMEYFECLRHFQLTHELVDVQECLFIPLLMSVFDEDKALRWREVLEGRLLDPSLRNAFDSLQRVRTNWKDTDSPQNRYSEEALDEIEGELRISFILPRPRDNAEAKFIPDAWAHYRPFFWTSTLEWWIAQMERLAIADRDRVFQRDAAPRIAENLIQSLRFAFVTASGGEIEVRLDATLISRYAEGTPLYVSIRPAGALPSIPREDIVRFRIWFDGELPPDARVMIESGAIRYRTPHLQSFLFNEPRILNDLAKGDDVVVATPLTQRELRSPREEDRQRTRKLLAHLNKHLERFHQLIFRSFHPNHRYMLLDGFEAPDANGWSIASVVENRLIGILGNCLVMPVARGRHLDPSFRQDAKNPVDLLAHYSPAEPLPAIRLSVPTRGVYAEAVMGDCNACEKKDESRFWRWDESPCPDEPTPIQPVSAGTRATTPPDVHPTPLPEPMVSIQNAPALPDPIGVSQALEILGRADLFKDITGLAGNQRNALVALQGALNTAKFFGGKAADFAMQQEASRNIDQTLQNVERARAGGLITDEQARSIAASALESMIGTSRPTAQAPQDSPAVQRAIDAATQSTHGEVQISTPAESVHAHFDDHDTTAGEGVTGSVVVPEFRDFTDWADIALTIGALPSVPGDFVEGAADGTVALFETRFRGFNTVTRQVFDLGRSLINGGVVARRDPADATKFQLRVRARVCYPIDPAHPGVAAGKGALPLVVLLHGNHDALTFNWSSAGPTTMIVFPIGVVPATKWEATIVAEEPNHLGYEDLQKELALNGIASISVDTNLLNHLDFQLQNRADMLLATLDRWRHEVDTNTTNPCHGRIDFQRVGLFGHSRGGDAVVRAAQDNALRLANQYGIRTVCSLSPTDYTGSFNNAMALSVAAAPQTTRELTYVVIYGSLDGDVAGWSDTPQGPSAGAIGTGFGHYDRATCNKAMVFVKGACHNRFHAHWGTEREVDPAAADLLSAGQHAELLRFYAGGLFRWTLGGETPLQRRFTGDAAAPAPFVTSLQWSIGDRLRRIDTFESPMANDVGTVRAMPFGDVIRFRDLTVNGVLQGTHVPHPTSILHADLNSVPIVLVSPTVIVESMPAPGSAEMDWHDFTYLTFRIGVWYDVNAPLLPKPLHVTVRLRDFAGNQADVAQTEFFTATVPGVPYLHNARFFIGSVVDHVENLTLLRLETVRIPLSRFATAGVVLNSVRAVEIDLDPADRLHVFIDSLELVHL